MGFHILFETNSMGFFRLYKMNDDLCFVFQIEFLFNFAIWDLLWYAQIEFYDRKITFPPYSILGRPKIIIALVLISTNDL